MEALREKKKLIGKKKSQDDEEDFEVPKDALGVTQYWIGKRIAKLFVMKAKAAYLRKQERDKQAGFFNDATNFDPEPAPEIEVSRPIIIPKKQDEESEYDFSFELHNLIYDQHDKELLKPSRVPSSKRRSSKISLPKVEKKN